MFKKATIKSIFRITALSLALFVLFTSVLQPYSVSAQAEQQASATQELMENISNAPTLEVNENANFHEINVGDLEFQGELDLNESKLVWVPWAGLAIGEVITWLTGLAAGAIAVHTIYKFGQDVVAVADFAAELSKSKQKDKPKYFAAKTDKTGLYILRPLQESEVVLYISNSSNEVWTAYPSDARSLASKFKSVAGPENHFDTGYNDTPYYYHFHGVIGKVRTGHIFYGTSSRLGLHKR